MAFWKPGAAKPDVAVDADAEGERVAFRNPLAGYDVNVQRRSLPIWEFRNSILYAVETQGVVVIVGETGCGKSTRECRVCIAS